MLLAARPSNGASSLAVSPLNQGVSNSRDGQSNSQVQFRVLTATRSGGGIPGYG